MNVAELHPPYIYMHKVYKSYKTVSCSGSWKGNLQPASWSHKPTFIP